MSADLIPFDFDGNAVRVVLRDGEPWFVAKDVCQCLGIVWKGSDSTGPLLDDDEWIASVVPTPGGPQKMACVSESGLYSLIFTSRKPEARRFRKWVTSEVLPSIRRTGGYAFLAGQPCPLELPPHPRKPAIRAQALNAAVQTAKLTGQADEEQVTRLFAHFCRLIAPDSVVSDCSELEQDEDGVMPLVGEFVERCARVTSVDPNAAPRHLKTQAKDIYAAFVDWCLDSCGLLRRDVPTHNAFGASLRRMPGIFRVSPVNKVFYNLVLHDNC
ncbi:MAG: BRO family protein [Desulfovibrio sp.]